MVGKSMQTSLGSSITYVCVFNHCFPNPFAVSLGSSGGNGSCGGDLSVWEFSGHDNYYMLYDHFIGNTNCIHAVVFNLADEYNVQLGQVRFWLNFLQSRIPPVEPLGT